MYKCSISAIPAVDLIIQMNLLDFLNKQISEKFTRNIFVLRGSDKTHSSDFNCPLQFFSSLFLPTKKKKHMEKYSRNRTKLATKGKLRITKKK